MWFATVRSPVSKSSSTYIDDPYSEAESPIVDIDASARRHGISDDDMTHAFRNHWRALATDDADVTMYIGPSQAGLPLEIGVVVDDEGKRSSTRCKHVPSS